MNAIYALGKYLFAIPFAIFGILHLMAAGPMNDNLHPPGGVAIVYITGIALIAATVSMLIGKYDKLATTLLALMLILFALIIQLKSAMNGDMGNLLKDIALAGAALLYAGNLARDKSVIG